MRYVEIVLYINQNQETKVVIAENIEWYTDAYMEGTTEYCDVRIGGEVFKAIGATAALLDDYFGRE